MSQALLSQVLRQFGAPLAGRGRGRGKRTGTAERRGDGRGRRNVLVGSDTFDDAGVYRLRPDCALVQTVDFFTPIVDDPYAYGQIAAANALSDVYAMGGRPITALNLLAVPADKLSPEAIAQILRGGADKIAESGAQLIGGHTIRNPEPVYGLSVTGVVHPRRILTNAAGRAGDLLVLTKPLGTGIATTAIKRGIASDKLVSRVTAVMSQLNTAGAELAERGLVKAATDITGFGLLGHLANLVRGSGVAAEIRGSDVPVLSAELDGLIDADCVPGGTRANLAAADEIVAWQDVPERRRILLADAQTSGGLLLCVPPRRLDAVKKVLRQHRAPVSAILGRLRRGEPRIVVS